MNLSDKIKNSKKQTILKVYLKSVKPLVFDGCEAFGDANLTVVVGQAQNILPVLEKNAQSILQKRIEYYGLNSAVPLADYAEFDARIEPFAVVRQGVKIGANAVIMHGAVLNIDAEIGENTMVDINAVVGSGAKVGKNCHIGAGAVIAGMLEPACNIPVVIADGVLIGANAVVLEGVRVGQNAVVGAGAVVTKNVPPFAVVMGCPAVVKRYVDDANNRFDVINSDLRGN